ncbi:MAG: MFS transporter [Burkholderia sp.]
MDSSSATSLSAGAASPASSRAVHLPPTRAAIAVLALGLGCFCFVSTELMPVSVLPAMAAGLGVSLGEVGYLVSCFAFVVALAAMPLTDLLGGLDRKPLMAALLAVCAAGNLLTYLAPGYLIVLAGRILVAAAIAVFWSTAVVTAVQLVAPKHAVRATSIVFGGVSLATVLGIPAGTLLGEHAGWRAVFAALTILSLVVFAAVLGSVPRLRVAKTSIRSAMPAVLRDGPLLGLLACTGLIVTGNFLDYTYVTPYLAQAAHLAPGRVGMMLLVYGAAGVLGNFAVGPVARRAPRTGLALVSLLLAAMHLAVASEPAIIALLAIWGGGLRRAAGVAADLGVRAGRAHRGRCRGGHAGQCRGVQRGGRMRRADRRPDHQPARAGADSRRCRSLRAGRPGRGGRDAPARRAGPSARVRLMDDGRGAGRLVIQLASPIRRPIAGRLEQRAHRLEMQRQERDRIHLAPQRVHHFVDHHESNRQVWCMRAERHDQAASA